MAVTVSAAGVDPEAGATVSQGAFETAVKLNAVPVEPTLILRTPESSKLSEAGLTMSWAATGATVSVTATVCVVAPGAVTVRSPE